VDLNAARDVVDELELDLWTAGVCLPCLTYVAFPLDQGREDEARGELRRLVSELWQDGLDVTAPRLLEDARRRGVTGADEALAEVTRQGPRSAIVRAIVWRLAQLMVEDLRRQSASRALP
jgi:hypothetical protein